MDGFTADDWAMLATQGNDIALQWYLATHGQQGATGAAITLPGVRAGLSGQQITMLVLGGLALFLLLKR